MRLALFTSVDDPSDIFEGHAEPDPLPVRPPLGQESHEDIIRRPLITIQLHSKPFCVWDQGNALWRNGLFRCDIFDGQWVIRSVTPRTITWSQAAD